MGEAFALGDRVAILRDGRVAQVAPPDDLWARPADDWVARFLGMRNVAVDGTTATVTRPEAVRLVPGDGAVVVATERDGPVVRVQFVVPTEEAEAALAAAPAGTSASGATSPVMPGATFVSLIASGVSNLPAAAASVSSRSGSESQRARARRLAAVCTSFSGPSSG